MTEPVTDQIPDQECLRCRTTLTDWGIHEFRTGGTGGASKPLIAKLAELGDEKVVPFHLRYCSRCGQVDVRLPAGQPSGGRW
jgi:hypothetical protein